MKFPLPERPFAPLQLARDQCDAYERLALAVVRECLDERDEFVEQQHCRVDPRVWKAVKTRDDLCVYKKRERETMHLLDLHTVATASASTTRVAPSASVSLRTKWSLPKLLGVGAIAGDVDDVLYGLAAPDVASIKVKTSYVDDEIVDCDVLHTIQTATVDEPFRFVGIKWLAKASPSGSLVWPRDMIVVDATGVFTDPTGQRFGYHVTHSVELPQCPSLDHLGIVRCKTSLCVLFKAAPQGSVEVFMTSLVEPGGAVPKSVAIVSAANGVVGVAKAVDAAETKKLAWLLRQASSVATRGRQRGAASAIEIKTDHKGRKCCALCDVKFATFRSPVQCQLCRLIVCSRCETTRKITYVTSTRATVKRVATPVCKTCVVSVHTMPAVDFAQAENAVRAGSVARRRSGLTRQSRSERAGAGSGRVLSSVDRGRLDSLASTERSSYVSSTSLVGVSVDSSSCIDEMPTVLDEDETLETAESDLVVRTTIWETPPIESQMIPLAASPQMIPLVSHREQLWRQMQQLQVQAEQAYQLTTQNNHSMAESMGPRPRPRPQSAHHIEMGGSRGFSYTGR